MRSQKSLKQRFLAMWKDLELRGNAQEEFRALVKHYSEPERHYHTLTHLAAGFVWFDRMQHQMREPELIEFAFWYHDVVYDPRSAENEEQSANIARIVLRRSGASRKIIEKVAKLILCTKHVGGAVSHDAAILLDIDLSVLGSNSASFARYEQGIHHEYGFVPEDIYRTKRAEFLASMLGRRMFSRGAWGRRLEEGARKNVGVLIEQLHHQ